jgi:hypothetical protein
VSCTILQFTFHYMIRHKYTIFGENTSNIGGPLMVAQWVRYCATNRKVAGSIPDGVIGIFH